MSIAIAITVTQSTYTKTTLPPSAAGGSARSMAATDRAITEIGELVRRYFANQFQSIDPNADHNTTVAITVT